MNGKLEGFQICSKPTSRGVSADGVSTADVVSITSVVSKCCSDHGVCSIAIVTYAHGTKRPSHVLAPDRCRIDHVRHTAAGETVGSGGSRSEERRVGKECRSRWS